MRSPVKKNLNIIVAGFGCCKQEIFATTGPLYDISRFGVNFVSIPEEADVLVFQGFYNKSSIKRVLDMYYCMREPRWVMAVGKCVVDHNVFCRDCNFLKEIEARIKIDFYVPGCPPRPEAFIYSVLKLTGKR